MGETYSLAGFACHKVTCFRTLCALLLLCVFFSAAKAHAMSADELALKQRLPVAMKVTTLEAKSRIKHWQGFLKNTRHKSEADKLTAVNDYFNALRFIEDATLWQKLDYWATPLQVLAAGAGDCEDIAIAKYITLKNLGIPNEHLRITYVWHRDAASAKRVPHMVLTYTSSENGDPLVLDILTNDIQTLAQRNELEAVYSVNSEGFWLVGDNAQAISAGGPAQLLEWRQLSLAMESDAALLRIL